MRGVLLDTNVIVGASDLSEVMSDSCKRNCLQRIKQWRAGMFSLVLDTEGVIIQEYLKQFRRLRSQKGFQGSLGDHLLRELSEMSSLGQQFNRYPTLFVLLTQRSEHEYEEFPLDPELEHFDRADRKWIAAARSYRLFYSTMENPEILNAADSDWNIAICDFLLEKHQIIVSNICG